MCGIAVAIAWANADEVVRQLVQGMLHRGDITDPLVSPLPNVAMCTRRLRIVDADHASQPQVSGDGRILVAFNGEIYNHAELRRELEAGGVAFKTQSDTEVLASMLSVWGHLALHRINGMYAFVAIDLATGDFLAARDPLGVKPLYVIQAEGGFVFCSEIRPLLSTIPSGDALLLPPGHVLTQTTCLRFQSVTHRAAGEARAHDPKSLDRLLAAAVHSRLPPDLPAAVMFSGGIDSTLIAHYARQIRPETPGYFLGDSAAPDYAYAARYADKAGLDLRCVDIDAADGDTRGQIDQIVRMTETFHAGVIRDSRCTFRLARRIHQDGYRVALCGEGADELFAGYIPLEQAFAQGDREGNFVRDQCLGTMHRTNLQRVDRCGMRVQLETRQPFLDPSVVAYGLSLGASDLVRIVDGHAWGKQPLRSLYDLPHNDLPALIRDRRKVPLAQGAGFDVSQDDGPWTDFAEQAVSDGDFAEGRRAFAPFAIQTKEELLYLQSLAATLDVWRAPHLQAERRLLFPGRLSAGSR
jgi:asparagine synthase (glutamine-hydrolysing)